MLLVERQLLHDPEGRVGHHDRPPGSKDHEDRIGAVGIGRKTPEPLSQLALSWIGVSHGDSADRSVFIRASEACQSGDYARLDPARVRLLR